MFAMRLFSWQYTIYPFNPDEAMVDIIFTLFWEEEKQGFSISSDSM